MAYNDRNELVLHDLHKLLEYKDSEKLRTVIYSYIFVFSRNLGYEIDIPENITLLKDVSVRDSNDIIIERIRITKNQSKLLELETLRHDAKKRRQQRYMQNKHGSETMDEYQARLELRRQEFYQEYLKQKKGGISTTQIAKNLHMSRGRLYQIITAVTKDESQ